METPEAFLLQFLADGSLVLCRTSKKLTKTRRSRKKDAAITKCTGNTGADHRPYYVTSCLERLVITEDPSSSLMRRIFVINAWTAGSRQASEIPIKNVRQLIAKHS